MITPQVLWFVAAQALGALIAGILADRWWKALLAVAAGVGFLFLSPVVPPDLFRPLVPAPPLAFVTQSVLTAWPGMILLALLAFICKHHPTPR